MNRTLKILILSDIFIFGGFGMVNPIFAIFLKDNLVGGSIFAAGVASAIFMITHSVLQIFFAHKFNPKDRLWMLILGTILIAITPFGYIFATHINHIYFVQFIYGLGAAFAYPAWYSLFSANLDRGQQGFQWSIHSTGVGMGAAATAAIGAFIAEKASFEIVFIITGILSLLGLFVLFGLEKKILKKI